MPNNNSGIALIEQGRAKEAYTFVETIKKRDDKTLWDEYTSGVKKLPVLIKTNGLGQALAFIKNPNKRGLHTIYENITTWLNDKYLQDEDLVKYVVNQNSTEYRYLTTEVLALLNWMRRFVDGMDKEEAPSDTN